MKRLFRKYHRAIAIIVALPILLTVLTGIAATIIREWGLRDVMSTGLLMRIHTGEVFHLQAVYPLLTGVGLLGLIVTGLVMAGVFEQRPRRSAKP